MSYEIFADFYDELTGNADYKVRAEYILSLCKKFNHDLGLTLDLACGTGTLTMELKRRGVDIYGIDASCDMLSVAQQKACEARESVLFLCQKMQDLDLFGTINTCICTLDSLNHLPDIKDVKKTFEKVSLFMETGGLFIFDVNTPYKHQKVLADNAFVFDTDNVYCVWQNTPGDNLLTEISLDFFIPEGDRYIRYSENFSERGYTEEALRALLSETGFEVLAVYGDMTEEKPSEEEQRMIFVAKKLHSIQKAI
ncbi:MAG: class I SAM-dependent DNA methyltransferase [Ruminococcus sp.]